jgi:acetate kinase
VRRAARLILVLNTGSSSVKFALYDRGTDDGDERRVFRDESPRGDDAVDRIIDQLDSATRDALVAVAHRVVHGGPTLSAPVWITATVRQTLVELVPLAPDHLPSSLHAIDAVARRLPGLAQAACFDTAFHRRMPPVARLFALPRAYADTGVVRYGFHGLSYEYVAGELARLDALAPRTIIAHLGNGASLAALRDGVGVDTTMGLTPTGGVVMATRAGDLDPGVVLYLLRHHHLTPDEVSTLVNDAGGMLGLSNLSGDVRTLLDREPVDPYAAQALDAFTYSVRKAIGALAAALGGLDSLVFTAGIGEHSAPMRARIAMGLQYLGIEIDPARNDAHQPVISAAGARVAVRVIATNEELMLARHVRRLLETAPPPVPPPAGVASADR